MGSASSSPRAVSPRPAMKSCLRKQPRGQAPKWAVRFNSSEPEVHTVEVECILRRTKPGIVFAACPRFEDLVSVVPQGSEKERPALFQDDYEASFHEVNLGAIGSLKAAQIQGLKAPQTVHGVDFQGGKMSPRTLESEEYKEAWNSTNHLLHELLTLRMKRHDTAPVQFQQGSLWVC